MATRIAVRTVLLPMVLGALLGIFSARGDGVQITVVNGLANAASPWILVAFAAGTLQTSLRLGAVAGALALLVAVLTYYVGFLFGGATFLLPFLALWATAAVAGGGLFGFAGSAWRSSRPRWAAAAIALVAGALLAEAAHRLILLQVWTGIEWHRTYMQVAVADFVAAALVIGLLSRDRVRAALALVPVVTLAGVGLLSAGEWLLRIAGGG
jgi:hypothetical protein